MSDSYYSMYDPLSEDTGVLSDLTTYVAKPEQTLSAALAPRMALGQNPPVTTQTQMAPPPPPPPPPPQQATGDSDFLSRLLGSFGGMGGMGGGNGFTNGGYVEEPEAFAQGGLVPLAGGGKIAIGPGGGLDDLIPTTIGGSRAAALSDGEFVIPADVVSMMGDGSSNAGARRLYDLVKQIREVKTGTDTQAKPLPVGDILKRTLS